MIKELNNAAHSAFSPAFQLPVLRANGAAPNGLHLAAHPALAPHGQTASRLSENLDAQQGGGGLGVGAGGLGGGAGEDKVYLTAPPCIQ